MSRFVPVTEEGGVEAVYATDFQAVFVVQKDRPRSLCLRPDDAMPAGQMPTER
jgi:hypothetical protein